MNDDKKTQALDGMRAAAAAQDAANRARTAAARQMEAAAAKARSAGLTFQEIGAAVGISPQRASYLAGQAKRN